VSVETEHPAGGLRRFVERAARPPTSPYRNLEPFRFADAGILAGRDREVERLVRLITMYRGVLLYGESGVGKSSVVNAGLLPRMVSEGFWPHSVRVQPRSGQELVLEAISASDEAEDGFLPSAFAGADERGRIALSAREFPRAVAAATDLGAILLVFDQFEELVTLFPGTTGLRQAQDGIVEAIVALLRGGAINPGHDPREPQPMIPVKLLFSFREDYLAGLRLLLDSQPELVHQSLRLVAPPQSATIEIIRAPFVAFPGHYPRELSDDLAHQIADSLREHRDGEDLPLSELQIVCDRVWKADEPAALLAQRGVAGLVEDHLEDALSKFEGNDRDAAIAVLGQLITSSNTRNIVARSNLVERAVDQPEGLTPAVIERVVARLEQQSGLIRAERRHDLDLYEITSEFLIPWISRQRDQLVAGRARREQETKLKRQRRTISFITGVLVIIAVFAVVATFEAIHASHEKSAAQAASVRAVRQGNIARTFGREATKFGLAATEFGLAATAQTLLNTRPVASLILALAAYRDDPGLPAAQTSIIAALSEAERSGATGILHGSANTVTSVAFDPARNTVLASGSADGTIRLWNTESNRQIQEFALPGQHPGGVYSLAFSHDGGLLAAGAQSGTVWLWTVRSSGAAATPSSPTWSHNLRQGLVNSVAFSSDGHWLAAAGLDAGIEIEALSRSGTPVGSPRRFAGSHLVRSIAFGPDSQTLVSVGNTGVIQRWHVTTRTPEGAPVSTHGALYTVAFAPHGNEFAAGGLSGNLYLLNLSNTASFTLGGTNRPAINSIAFSPNGQRLAAGDAGDSVQLWDVGRRRAAGRPLAGQKGIITSVAFSPSGRSLAAGSTDQTIRLWPIPPSTGFGRALATNLGSVDSVAFGPGGRFAAGAHWLELWRQSSGGVPSGPMTRLSLRLSPGKSVRALAFDPVNGVLASAQGTTVRLWNEAGRELGPTLSDGGHDIFTVAFSPDGQWLAFAGKSAVTLWRLNAEGRPSGSPTRLDSSHVFGVVFSPTRPILASGGEDRTIGLWGYPSGPLLHELTGDSDAVNSLAFAPNGKLLASGSDDDTVRLWNVDTGAERGQALIGSHGYVRSVAFNPKGTILVSGSADGTVRLWNVASGAGIGEPLSVDSAAIQSVTFSPNGTHVVSGGRDGDVRVWPVPQLHYDALRSQVCSLVGTGLSTTEWSQSAGPTVTYKDPCR
jgi:WD40 repeat protein